VKEAIARGDMRMTPPKVAAPPPSIGTFEDAVRYAADAVEHLGRPMSRVDGVDVERDKPVYERLTPCGFIGCGARAEKRRGVRIHGHRTASADRDDLCPKHYDAWIDQERGQDCINGITDRPDVKDISPHLHGVVLREPIQPQAVEFVDDLVAADVE
jgi:hypothetical protein